MGNQNDLVGRKFGVWNVIKRESYRHGHMYWICKCEYCGRFSTKRGFNLLNGMGLKCKCLANATYTLNKQFFREIKNEYQAYVLGFICADGYVHKNGKSVSIAIKESDIQILEIIKNAIQSNAKLLVKRKPSNQEDLFVLNISSRELVDDLARLGIGPNKTKVITLPRINNDLYRHFFRGLFDGDGYGGKRQFALTGGSVSILKSLQELIFRETGQKLMMRELKKDSFIRGYQLYGSKRDKGVLDWTYQFSTIRLERKYNKYLEFWT